MNFKQVTLTVAALAFAGSAYADVINGNRPFDNGNLSSLQGALNGAFTGANAIDAVNDQSNTAVWTPDEAAVDTYVITLLNTVDTNFGIYSYSNGTEVSLDFNLSSPQASFVINDAGDLYVDNALAAANFGHEFGFWAQNTFDLNTFYSEDSKNGGDAHALTYQLDDNTDAYLANLFGGTTVNLQGGNDWVIAFEDFASPTFGDYDDLVFLVEDVAAVSAVPVPAAAWLFGSGLIGLVGVARRKKA